MVSSLSPLNFLLCLIYSCFYIIGPNGVVLCCYSMRFIFLSKGFPFLTSSTFSCLSLKMSIDLFFILFLFSDYVCSADPRIVSIVSGNRNQSSSALFYVVFELYRCINAIFKADKSSSSFFLDTNSLSTSSLRYNALHMVIRFLIL